MFRPEVSATACRSGVALGYALVRPRGMDALALESMSMAAVCEKRGLTLGEVVTDAVEDRDLGLERAGLEEALARIARGQADCLVVAGLEGLMLSAATVGALVDWLSGARAGLVVADLELDTREPGGRIAARALVAAGDLDRRKLRERTRRGLAAARRRGGGGGRPAVADRPDLRGRIASWRAAGLTLQAIADRLNAEGVPTLRGGSMWRPSSVQVVAAGYNRPRARAAADRRRRGPVERPLTRSVRRPMIAYMPNASIHVAFAPQNGDKENAWMIPFRSA